MIKLPRFSLASIVWMLGVAQAGAANLVVNGDFESGNTGFESDYTYASTCAGVSAEGIYTIATFNCYNGALTGDADGPPGNLLFANGATNTSQFVWRQGIVLPSIGRFLFSAQAANAGSQSPPDLLIQVSEDGLCGVATSFTTIGSVAASTTGWDWSDNSGIATISGSTNVCVRLLNNNTSFSGNDFGLDNIFLDAIYPVTATVSNNAAGSVTCTPAQPVPGGEPNEVLNGGSVTCTVTVNSGYTFNGWTGACSGQGETCTLNDVDSARASIANFDAPISGGAHTIPSLSEWMLGLTSLLLAAIAGLRLNSKRKIG